MQLKVVAFDTTIFLSVIPGTTHCPKHPIYSRPHYPNSTTVLLCISDIPKHEEQKRHSIQITYTIRVRCLCSRLNYTIEPWSVDGLPGVCCLHVGTVQQIGSFLSLNSVNTSKNTNRFPQQCSPRRKKTRSGYPEEQAFSLVLSHLTSS